MNPRFLSDENYHLQQIGNVIAQQLSEFRADGMPRYGHLSLMPFMLRVYDNEAFANRCGKTAFVVDETGEVYFYAGFLQKLLESDMAAARANCPTTNVIFFFLHELSHQYLGHIQDVSTLVASGLSSSEVNIAMDTCINSNLMKYDDIVLGADFNKSVWDEENNVITEGFLGLHPKEQAFFRTASYIEIAWHYHEQLKKLEQQRPKKPKNDGPESESKKHQGNGQEQSNQSGQGGQKSDSSHDQGGTEKGTEPSNGQQKGGQEGVQDDVANGPGGEFGVDHNRSLKDVVDALKDSGLDHVAKHFGYPAEVTKDIEETYNRKRGEVLDRIDGQMQEIMRTTGKGDHMANFFTKEWEAARPKQLSLDNLDNLISANFGGDLQYTDAEPGMQVMMDSSFNMEYYGVPSMPYEGIYAPLQERKDLFVIVDSSYSMTVDGRINHALGAVTGVVQNNPQITGVYLCYADSLVRKIEYIDRETVESLRTFNVAGHGGTDMAQAIVSSLVMAQSSPEPDTSAVKAMVLIHDGDDTELGDRMGEVYSTVIEMTGHTLPPLICLIPPGCGANEFIRSMEKHAAVLLIDDGKQLRVDYNEVANKSASQQAEFRL